MNPVIDLLVDLAEQDPLPARHTSSHWQRYGRETTVARQGDTVVLRAAGFTAQSKANVIGKLLYGAERLSYRRLTDRLGQYATVWKAAKTLARDLSVGLTRHEWSSAVVLAVLADHLTRYGLSPRTFALIGDGDGFLGALIRRYLSARQVTLYSIDLPKMLVFQACTHEAADPKIRMSLLRRGRQDEAAAVTFVHPEDIEEIGCEIDCATSLVSMQEMPEASVASYFGFLRRRSTPQSRFYCIGRLRNELPGGEVLSFADYPWQAADEVFLDGPFPYFRHFFDQHRYAGGPRLLGARIPFVNYFDGVAWHRLVRLAASHES